MIMFLRIKIIAKIVSISKQGGNNCSELKTLFLIISQISSLFDP